MYEQPRELHFDTTGECYVGGNDAYVSVAVDSAIESASGSFPSAECTGMNDSS